MEERTIQATATTFRIIEYINQHDESGVVELAEELDLAKSTIHSHLTTLTSLNYLNKKDGKYKLELKFLDHGAKARDDLDFYSVAKAEVTSLADEIDQVVWLYTEDNGLGMVLDVLNYDHSEGYTPARIGWRPHLHCISAGKAILAHLPEQRVDEIVDDFGLPRMTDQTITSRDELNSELENIRERGYAFHNEEKAEGLYAIGAPFFRQDEVLGSVSISGPSYKLTKEDVNDDLITKLLDTTSQIEVSLKYK